MSIFRYINDGQIGLIKKIGNTGALSPYIKEANDYFKRMTTAPSAAFKKLVNAYIVEQKASGLWDKKVVIVLLQAESAQAATLNMKADFNNATFVNSPTFVAGDGVTSDVGYINSNFNPATHGGTIVTQNSTSILMYIKSDRTASNTLFDNALFNASVPAPNGAGFSAKFTGNVLRGYINNTSATNTSIAVTTAVGINSVMRTASDRTVVIKNNNISTASTQASLAPVSLNYFFGTYNNNGTPALLTNSKYGYYEIGAGLSDAEVLINYNQLKTLLNYTP